MPSSTDSWGIEVGAHAIKAMHLQKTGGGKAGASVALVEHEVIPHKKVLSTPDVDVDESIRTGLAQLISRHQLGRASVVVSVPGNMAFARFAKMPPVEPKRVPDIVKFEAIQQIPFPIDQVEWDYQVFQQADSPEVEVGIFAITKERVMSWLSHFDAAGISVHGVTLSPVAVYNAMAYDLALTPESPGVMLMDVGTLSTDLIVVTEGRIWLRTLPLGGHHFTEAIAKGFKLSYSKAEKIKKEAATSKYARQIFQAMRPVFVDLVAEVQKSLGYYQSINRDVHIRSIIGMGSTFRLPGLQKFIKQQLQVEVTRLDSYKRIEPEGRVAAEFAEHAAEMPAAYGLALQGLEMESVSANILPAGLIRAQVWRTKTKWNVAAAACIAAAAVVPIMRLTLDRAAYASANDQHSSAIQSAIRVAEEKVNKLKQVEQEDPRPRIENIRAIHDYRELWPLLMVDIQQAIASAAAAQPQLKSGDPEELKKIARRDRRELIIQSIEAEYLPDGQTARTSGGAGAFPGGPFGGAPGGFGGGGGDEGYGGESPSSGGSSGAKPPTLMVTVRGYTTCLDSRNRTAARNYVEDTVVKWLREEGAGLKRPYRIAEVTPTYTDRATDRQARGAVFGGGAGGGFQGGFDPTGGAGFRGQFDATRRGALPGTTDRSALPGTRPTTPPGTSPVPGQPTRPDGQPQAPSDVWSFFPTDPLADEERVNDLSVELKLRVELLPAEQARKIARMSDTEFRAYIKKQRGEAESAESGDGEADDGGDAQESTDTDPQSAEVNP